LDSESAPLCGAGLPDNMRILARGLRQRLSYQVFILINSVYGLRSIHTSNRKLMALRDLFRDQLTKQIDESHFTNGTGGSAGDARVGYDDRKALGAGDCHVDPIAIQDEAQPA